MSNMRGLDTQVRAIRRRVFKEVAKLGFEANSETLLEDMEAIPYEIVNDDTVKYRESTYRSRAIVRERLRLAMGLSLRPEDKPVHLTAGVQESNISEKYYEPPLMQVIPSACESCEENKYEVSNMCKGCLAHPCSEVCPKGAISMVNGKSYIDQEKCIKCGKCKAVCPYDAIAKKERPCKNACGVGAIVSDKYGRAYIDTEKCVSCGMCMVSCPFGAISDKSQIFQLTRALQEEGSEIIAEIAPAFVGQFGENINPRNIKAALIELGFKGVHEVALGADIGAVAEAHHYVEKVVTGELPFLLTSCCPAWVKFITDQYKEYVPNISTCRSPQGMMSAVIKEYFRDSEHAAGKKTVMVSIMPCTAKKAEAVRPNSYTHGEKDTDIVITTTELLRMIDNFGLDFAGLEPEACDMPFGFGSGGGVIFGVTGGVTEAVLRRLTPDHSKETMREISECGVRGDEGIKEFSVPYKGMKIKICVASGLANARIVMDRVKNGEAEYHLIEVMACRRGCIMGGGQPTRSGDRTKAARAKGLYNADNTMIIKKSDENPMVLELYQGLLKGKEHELLHNEFTPDKYDRIDIILENLRNYTVKHFSDEEQYMESINYKKIFTQKVQHQEFIHKLDEFMEHHNDEVEDQDEQIMGILKYLTEWLVNHILYVDGQIPKG